MVAQGGQGPWHPRGSGLLTAVVALSVVALLGHGIVALHLLNGTVHQTGRTVPSSASGPRPTPAGPTSSGQPTRSPQPTPLPTRQTTPTPIPSRGGTPTAAVPTGNDSSPLHLDHSCLVADNPPPAKAHFPTGDPFGTDITELGQGAELQRLYAVQHGALVPADNGGAVRDCDQQLWRVVTASAPPEVLGYVDELLVFDADLGNGPDYYVGEVQSLQQSTERASHWRLSLAPNGATDVDVALTVAHEVGHLASLGASQMTGEDENACQGIYLDEGCLKDDAGLASFFDDTWSDDDWDAWDSASSITDDDQRMTALQKFYDDHSGSFVDAYGATDPAEDFAESFGVWCAIGPGSPLLPDVIQGAPGNGAAKLAWFDQPGNPVAAATRAQCEQLRALTR